MVGFIASITFTIASSAGVADYKKCLEIVKLGTLISLGVPLKEKGDSNFTIKIFFVQINLTKKRVRLWDDRLYLDRLGNCERIMVSFTKNKATAQPCRVRLGFLPVNTSFF